MSKGASADAETGSREPSSSSTGLGPPGFDPARLSIYGEAVPAYERKCGVCGGVAPLDQLNRYFHYAWDEASGEHVIWLPGRYCSRECMAIAMEARRGETAETGSTAEGGDSAGPEDIAQ